MFWDACKLVLLVFALFAAWRMDSHMKEKYEHTSERTSVQDTARK